MRIASLGYLGIEATELDFWETSGPEVLGLGLAEGSGGDVVRLRVDDRAHRLTVRRAERDRVAYVGWEVGSDDEVQRAVEHLEKAGVRVEPGTDEEKLDRAVRTLVWFDDPFGIRHEVFAGQLTVPNSFTPGRAMTGFVTGEQGLGHVVLVVPDKAKATDFYTSTMGFRLTDTIDFKVPVPGVDVVMELVFFHVNARHHSLAITPVPGMRGIQHLLLQVQSLDDVGSAYDLCQQRGLQLSLTLGRHVNDRMLSFYLRTPSGMDIEYGWGAIEVDDEGWVASSYDRPSIWGHQFAAEGPPGVLEPVA